MTYKYRTLSGDKANASELEDEGALSIIWEEGPHKGHEAEILTAKHNCGAYAEEVICRCGQAWYNAMNGCWQWGHQRGEEGDSTLEPN